MSNTRVGMDESRKLRTHKKNKKSQSNNRYGNNPIKFDLSNPKDSSKVLSTTYQIPSHHPSLHYYTG